MGDGGKWLCVAGTGELAKGTMKAVAVAGYDLALYHLDDGTWCASDLYCTHAEARLTDGWLEGCIIECPLHAGRFDLSTGAGQGAPVEEDLPVYPVRTEGDAVLVQLPPD